MRRFSRGQRITHPHPQQRSIEPSLCYDAGVHTFPKLKCPSRALCTKFRWTKCCSPSNSMEQQCPSERVPDAHTYTHERKRLEALLASTCTFYLAERDGSDWADGVVLLCSPSPGLVMFCRWQQRWYHQFPLKVPYKHRHSFQECSYTICTCNDGGGGKRIAPGCESDGCHMIIRFSCRLVSSCG